MRASRSATCARGTASGPARGAGLGADGTPGLRHPDVAPEDWLTATGRASRSGEGLESFTADDTATAYFAAPGWRGTRAGTGRHRGAHLGSGPARGRRPPAGIREGLPAGRPGPRRARAGGPSRGGGAGGRGVEGACGARVALVRAEDGVARPPPARRDGESTSLRRVLGASARGRDAAPAKDWRTCSPGKTPSPSCCLPQRSASIRVGLGVASVSAREVRRPSYQDAAPGC
jgi:hypothetical protein